MKSKLHLTVFLAFCALCFVLLLSACESPTKLTAPESAPARLELQGAGTLKAAGTPYGVQCVFKFTARAQHALLQKTQFEIHDAGMIVYKTLAPADHVRVWSSIVVDGESHFQVLLGGTTAFTVVFNVSSTAGDATIAQICT